MLLFGCNDTQQMDEWASDSSLALSFSAFCFSHHTSVILYRFLISRLSYWFLIFLFSSPLLIFSAFSFPCSNALSSHFLFLFILLSISLCFSSFSFLLFSYLLICPLLLFTSDFSFSHYSFLISFLHHVCSSSTCLFYIFFSCSCFFSSFAFFSHLLLLYFPHSSLTCFFILFFSYFSLILLFFVFFSCHFIYLSSFSLVFFTPFLFLVALSFFLPPPHISVSPW